MKLRELIEYYKMRYFSSSETFIKWVLVKKGGKIKLSDGTWAVHQSDEFYKYCYSEGYKNWQSTTPNPIQLSRNKIKEQ